MPDCLGCDTDWRLATYQLLENTLVQVHLRPAALEKVVVIVLEALPVSLELRQAVGVDILDPVIESARRSILDDVPGLQKNGHDKHKRRNVHASGTARDLATLLQAIELPAAIALVLALHKVIVVGLAALADKVGGTEKGCGSGAELLDLRDVVRHGRGVHEDFLVETVRRGMGLVRCSPAERLLRWGHIREGVQCIPRFSSGHCDGW